MSKYIDADKMKAEIEKRLSIFEHGIAYDCWESCKKIVESLQQEQPEVDLEKELDSLITPELKKYKALPSMMDVAKHFYELGLNARKEENK